MYSFDLVSTSKSLVQKPAAINSPYVVGVIMSAIRKYPGPCSALARANVVASLRTVAALAADRGVTLGLEVVNRYETNVINTAAQGMALVDDIGAAVEDLFSIFFFD